MRFLKMLGFAMTAVAALALAASASAAPLITSPAGTEFTGEVHETLSGSWVLKSGSNTITCTEGTRIWDVTTNDENVAGGPVTGTTYSNCSSTVTVLSKGSLSTVSGGELKASKTELTVSILGSSCVYGAGESTKIGTVTGGSPAVVTESAVLPKISGGILCSSTASTSGQWTITFPNTFIYD